MTEVARSIIARLRGAPRRARVRLGALAVAVLAVAAPLALGGAGSARATEPPVAAAADGLLSLPAVHVRDLAVPGEGGTIERPCAIHVDRHFGEVLVADPSRARIVVFGLDGIYRFEFAVGALAAAPVDLTVDSEGFVHVLGATRDGVSLFRFDFDGLPLGEFPVAAPGEALDLRSIAIDRQDRLYLADVAGLRVLRCDRDGRRLGEFALLEDLDPKVRLEAGLGTVSVCGDTVLVPLPTLGYVAVHDLEGRPLGVIGHRGGNVGELNFPVAAELAPDGMVLVLDKNRFNVLCFAPDGIFLGEFGGKGTNPGWFYHPSLLAAARDGLVYVGQVFQNRIQVCAVPDAIRARHLRGRPQPGLTDEEAGGSGAAAAESGQSARRSQDGEDGFAPAAREGEDRLTSRVLHRTGGPTQ